jgi:hypothetical protein
VLAQMTAQAIDALASALDAERAALVNNDAEALLRANSAKIAALNVLEHSAPPPETHARLRELMERNRANGAMLARRQRTSAAARYRPTIPATAVSPAAAADARSASAEPQAESRPRRKAWERPARRLHSAACMHPPASSVPPKC